jgi:Cu-processing system permease protein
VLQRVTTIAYATYREAVRARILLGLAGVAVLLAVYFLFVAAFTLDEAPRVVSDLGAMTISVFSAAVAVLIGATSLHRELEMKTILPLLARPIHRAEFVVGKYAGIMLVVAVFVLAEAGLVLLLSALMSSGVTNETASRIAMHVAKPAVVLLVAFLSAVRNQRIATWVPIPAAAALLATGITAAGLGPGERSLILSSAALTFMEVAVVAAIAMVFASFSSPFLSAVLTLGTFVVGRSADTLARMPKRVFGPFIHDFAALLSRVVPNLHVYAPARPLLTGEAADAHLGAYLGMAALQTFGWMLGLLAVAAFVFQRRDFT